MSPSTPRADRGAVELDGDRLLSTASAAHFLDLHPTTLRKWRSADAGPAWLAMPNGYNVRYRLSDLKKWVGSGEVA